MTEELIMFMNYVLFMFWKIDKNLISNLVSVFLTKRDPPLILIILQRTIKIVNINSIAKNYLLFNSDYK